MGKLRLFTKGVAWWSVFFVAFQLTFNPILEPNIYIKIGEIILASLTMIIFGKDIFEDIKKEFKLW